MFDRFLASLSQVPDAVLARCISLVENGVPGYEAFMQQLPEPTSRLIGITGPPGAGKSTLVDALIAAMVAENKRVGVICVDPSSPFNLGALLGDRIRMSQWYTHPQVFIRSLATRGSLGGLHPRILEISSVMQAAGFDYVLVETVGVGQSEIEIAGLADTTLVVVVPEAGDEVQTMKAGLMEIADIFIVNKSDRPDADMFVKNLRHMMPSANMGKDPNWQIPVIKTVASKQEGVDELITAINEHGKTVQSKERKFWLLTEKAFHLIQQKKMNHIDKSILKEQIQHLVQQGAFNLYQFIQTID
jgi:LAO/AO transport system kinase